MHLIIDGNFYAQRLRNAANLNFIEDPEKDKKELFRMASMALASEIKSLNGCIEKVWMCRDWSSWRKKFDQVYPVENVKTEDKQVYKANRDGEKDYDPVKYFAAFDEWCELINTRLNIPTIRTKGAEADDLVYIFTKAFSMKKIMSIGWSSDGDYLQIVNEYTFLVKLPKRDLYKSIPVTVNEAKDMMSIFGAKPNKSKLLLESFDKNRVQEINPMSSLFFKVVHGDSKDNVPPMFFWKSGGKMARTMKPSKSHMSKALKTLEVEYSDITEDQMYTEDFIKKFITSILKVCKQTRNEEHTYKVYLSNLKMKHLSVKQIPQDIMKEAIKQLNDNSSRSQNIKKMHDYKWILSEIGVKETNAIFANFKLD